MPYKLQDIIDMAQFQALQDRLNEIYSFPSAIIDNDGNILTATAWQDICTRFHRVHPDSQLECIKSDQYIDAHLSEANPAVSYRCPHGLVDNATPIIIEGVHYGNFFTGQFFLDGPDLEFFKAQARRYGFDEEAYLQAVKKVPIWSQAQLTSYLFFIKGLIEVISGIGLKNLREIETRKKMEAAEERADTILREMGDGFWVIDPQGQIMDVNVAMCRLVGYTRAELLTMTVADVEANDSPAVIAERARQVIQAGSTHFESRFRRKDGPVIDVDISVTYLPERGLLFGFHRDITARKQAEAALSEERARLAERVEARTAELRQANAELLHASRLKDEFLANMSHELRTPLNGILGLSEALQMGTYGPLPLKPTQMLQVIHQSGEHLLALITDILDLSKIEADKLELQLAPAAVAEIGEASLLFIRETAHKKQLRVTFTPDPQVRQLRVDARRLKQMLVNLLGNAVKFTPEGGQVGLEVAGDPARHEVRFTVWDTGIGIPPEKQALLFQPFVQIDGRLERKYEGTGLGLALTRRLAEMHGGHVSVESAGVGQGSRFTVALPWQPVTGPLPALPVDKTPAPATLLLPSGRPAVILLAEDNEAAMIAMSDFLESFSAKVVPARNGLEALAQVSAARPDLILMDIQMPDLNGLDAIRRLKAASETTAIPIIALTALAMPGDRERCLAAGADDYLTKPVKLNDLLRAAGQYLKASP